MEAMRKRWQNLTPLKKALTLVIGIPLALLVPILLIGAIMIASGYEAPEPTPTPTTASATPSPVETTETPKPEPEPTTEAPTTPAAIDWQAEISKALGTDSLMSACLNGISWTCEIASIEPRGEGTIIVTVQTPERDKDYGRQVATSIFNMIGLDHPELDWIQVNNAIGNVLANLSRTKVPLLNK